MPKGNNVRPEKWSRVLDLFDDGHYSAIWGSYENSKNRRLGVRWSGGDNLGYPSQGKNPLWYAEPDFLTKIILLKLIEAANNEPNVGNVQNILVALKESS